ncbi:MAG: monovalent cation/H+ antiporter complex subunit F [Candidatus Aenigmatarchaeota archaeon]
MMYEIPVYILMMAAFVCIFRILMGPSIPDRVVAADAFVSITISIMVLLSLNSNDFLMDIAIVYAILGFIGTVAISKFLEGKKLGD